MANKIEGECRRFPPHPKYGWPKVVGYRSEGYEVCDLKPDYCGEFEQESVFASGCGGCRWFKIPSAKLSSEEE